MTDGLDLPAAPGADPARMVFMVGTGRCGSTLLHEVLARHPAVGFMSNVEDKRRSPGGGRYNSTVYDRVPQALTRKGRLRFAPSEGYRALSEQVSPMVVDPCRDLHAADATPWMAARFRAFFTERAAAQGLPVFLHKFTGWPRAGFIDAVFPEARFVHVVRDGRAVANSLLQMPWWGGYGGPERWGYGPLPAAYQQMWDEHGRSFPVLAGLCWRMLMDAHDAARAALPADRWLQVRYEDVIADPAAGFGAILDFLGVPPDRRFSERLARQRFSDARSDAFRRDLDPESLRRLEKVLAEPLERYGYSPDGDR
jgi:hypothetical protein